MRRNERRSKPRRPADQNCVVYSPLGWQPRPALQMSNFSEMQTDQYSHLGPGTYEVGLPGTGKHCSLANSIDADRASPALSNRGPRFTALKERCDLPELVRPQYAHIGPGYYQLQGAQTARVSHDTVAFLSSKASPRLAKSTTFSKDQLSFQIIEDRFDHLLHDQKAWECGVPLAHGERRILWSARPMTRGPSKEERKRFGETIDDGFTHRIHSIHKSGARGAAFPMVWHDAALDLTDHSSIANCLMRHYKAPVPGFMASVTPRIKPLRTNPNVYPGKYHRAYEANSLRKRTVEDARGSDVLQPSFGSSDPRFMSKREQRQEAIRRIGDTAGVRPSKPQISDEALDECPQYNSYLMTL